MVIPHTTVHDAVADAVRRWPERLAVVDEDRQLTFRELWQLSGAVAARLVAGSAGEGRLEAVSYTHLDVYKRQHAQFVTEHVGPWVTREVLR